MDWTRWKGASCLPDCWCEAPRVGAWILEPVNTWTNLTFILAGLVFLFRSRQLTTGTNLLTSDSLFPKLYGLALVFMGIGSFFFHASQTFIGQWFDVFGMYLVSMFYVSYNFYRIDWFGRGRFLLFYFVSCLLLGLIIYYFPDTRRWLFGASIAFTFVQSVWIQRRFKSRIKSGYLLGALVIYGIAQTVWILDKNKLWCDPYGWINGHGIWHILTGVSAVLTYGYFASEIKASK